MAGENRNKKRIIVCGAGGFIGNHLVNRLKSECHWVRGVDIKYPEFSQTRTDDFILGDLRNYHTCEQVFDGCFDEVYQLAADMGGAGFVFTGDNDARIMHNSALCNLNILEVCRLVKIKRIFYASSACIYPEYNQMDNEHPVCSEESAYPAAPDSEYGWEKLFSERLYLAFARNYGLEVRIARLHNIFGELGTWTGGREKAPAAICRKVAATEEGGTIEMWGDGSQTRSFLYVNECIEGILRLMRSDWEGPVNIGSEEMVSINQLAEIIMDIAGKHLRIKHVDGPLGVTGRNSDNRLIRKMLNWEPRMSLRDGLEITYSWIRDQVEATEL